MTKKVKEQSNEADNMGDGNLLEEAENQQMLFDAVLLGAEVDASLLRIDGEEE